MTQEEMKCRTCRFFDRVGGGYGFCRLKPPTVRFQKYSITGMGSGETNFPIVTKDERCGEWTEKEETND